MDAYACSIAQSYAECHAFSEPYTVAEPFVDTYTWGHRNAQAARCTVLSAVGGRRPLMGIRSAFLPFPSSGHLPG